MFPLHSLCDTGSTRSRDYKVMRIGVKISFLVTVFSILLVGFVGLYFGIYLKNYHEKRSIENFETIARISTDSYLLLEKSLKIRAVDWSSDGFVRGAVEEILDARANGESQRQKILSHELGAYIKDNKMIYDPSVVIVDVLDRDGIVIASSKEDRIGVDEKAEEKEHGAIRFQEAIASNTPEVFIKSVVYEEDEHAEPMIHLTIRIFQINEITREYQPLDAVLLVHYVNEKGLNDLFFLGYLNDASADTRSLLLNYQTAEIYLVNQNHLMVSSSRFVADAVLEQQVDSEPVKACFGKGRSITQRYSNYLGKDVLGSSVCLNDSGLVLIVEAQTEEIFNSISEGMRYLILISMLLLIMGVLSVLLIVKHSILRGITALASAAREVGRGNLTKHINVKSNDEIGMLSETFNYMTDSLKKSGSEMKKNQESLKNMNRDMGQKNEDLKKINEFAVGRELKMIELKKRIKELEESAKSKEENNKKDKNA